MKTMIKVSLLMIVGIFIASGCNKSSSKVTDIDGNEYKTVKIGTQVWMAENLKTTRYNDGTGIFFFPENYSVEVKKGYYVDYDNNPANSEIYGRLYNWYVVDNNPDTKLASNGGKNICPKGWHVPNDAEWTTLITYLGGDSNADKLIDNSTNLWSDITSEITNESGFTALPSGWREIDGSFNHLGGVAMWWSSTSLRSSTASIVYTYGMNIREEYHFREASLCIRCIKD